MAKKLLVAGGSYADIPMIVAAKKLGYYVVTSGNKPHEMGHQYSDEYQKADFSNKDEMLDLARKLKIDAIIPSTNDFSAITSAYVAENLGLRGHDNYETSLLIHHKDKFRELATNLGIPSPKARSCNNLLEALLAIEEIKLPVIVKPVDLTGGKGIAKISNNDNDNVSEAIHAAMTISRANRIVIEEFIDGSRHGLSTILRNGKIVFYFSDNEHYYHSQFLVSGASVPSSCRSESISLLISYLEKIAANLNLVDGILHAQFIQREDGVPIIIEICRRPPGDLYVELVHYATFAPYSEWIVKSAAGIGIEDVHQMPVKRCITRHCLMAVRGGDFIDFNFAPTIEKKIIDKMVWAKKGEKVLDHKTHKFGIVFLEFTNVDEMRLYDADLNQLLLVNVKA
jgi:biotin carboxylase